MLIVLRIRYCVYIKIHHRARTCDCIYYLDNVYEKTASNLPSDVLRQSIEPEREYRHSVEITCYHMCKYFADIHTHSMVQHRACRRAHDTRFLQTTAMRCDQYKPSIVNHFVSSPSILLFLGGLVPTETRRPVSVTKTRIVTVGGLPCMHESTRGR